MADDEEERLRALHKKMEASAARDKDLYGRLVDIEARIVAVMNEVQAANLLGLAYALHDAAANVHRAAQYLAVPQRPKGVQ